MKLTDLPKTGLVCLAWRCRECGATVAGGYYHLPREATDMRNDVEERTYLNLRIVPTSEQIILSRHIETCRIRSGDLE
jgi:hypothetical protein